MKSEQVVQQNKASGKVQRQAEVTFTYTPNGLHKLHKTLLRTAPCRDRQCNSMAVRKKGATASQRLPSICAWVR